MRTSKVDKEVSQNVLSPQWGTAQWPSETSTGGFEKRVLNWRDSTFWRPFHQLWTSISWKNMYILFPNLIVFAEIREYLNESLNDHTAVVQRFIHVEFFSSWAKTKYVLNLRTAFAIYLNWCEFYRWNENKFKFDETSPLITSCLVPSS